MLRLIGAVIILAALSGAPSPMSTVGHATAETGSEEQAADDGLAAVLLVPGVAGVALVGTATLVAVRRHGRGAGGGPRPAGASDAAAAQERRALRQARMRLDEDPIMAAMGIGSEDEPRPHRPTGRRR